MDLYDNSIVLCIVRLCMLEIIVCWRAGGVFFFCNKQNRTIFIIFFICVLGVFWQEFSLFLIRCALYLHACLLWLWFLEMRLNIACRFLHVKDILLDFSLKKCCFFCWTGLVLQWSNMWKHFKKLLVRNPPLWFLTEHWCAKTLSIILILKKRHTQSRCCFVLSVFLSFYRSKATVFAFSGQRPAVKAPYQLLSMFQSLSLSPRQTESLCLVTAVCLHADYHGSGPEQESLISDEVKSCNQYKQTQTTQLTDLK